MDRFGNSIIDTITCKRVITPEEAKRDYLPIEFRPITPLLTSLMGRKPIPPLYIHKKHPKALALSNRPIYY